MEQASISTLVTQADLRKKLRKIEALLLDAATPGERDAAEGALARLRAKLPDGEEDTPAQEIQFSLPDQWSRQLFVALCRRYGLKPYRYAGQRRTTVMVKAPRSLIDDVVWRQFCDIETSLHAYLQATTLKIISEEIHADASEPQELPRVLPAA